MLAPLVGLTREQGPTVDGRARTALERDKALTLRAIKELEFDRAMGKVSEADFVEMRGLLRQRAMRLMRQLEGGEVYKTLIERDLALAPDAPATHRGTTRRTRAPVAPFPPTPVRRATRSTTLDARFCKHCGKAHRLRRCVRCAGCGERTHMRPGALVCIAGAVLVAASPSGAQMPDPRIMSGQIMPAPELAAGTVTVRVIRQAIMNVIPGVDVELHGAGDVRHATSGPDGRAVFTSVPAGAHVHAVAVVDNERLTSIEFDMPRRRRRAHDPRGGRRRGDAGQRRHLHLRTRRT